MIRVLLWAVPAALAVIGVHRVSSDRGRALAITAAGVLWVSVVLAVVVRG